MSDDAENDVISAPPQTSVPPLAQMRLRLLHAALASACLAAGAAPAIAQLSDSGEFLDGVAAVVNDGVVLTSELEGELAAVRANIRAQGLGLPPSNVLERQVLERLVLREIQLQRADRMGIEISDEQVNRALGFVARQTRWS